MAGLRTAAAAGATARPWAPSSRCWRLWRLRRSRRRLTIGASGCGGGNRLRAPLPRSQQQQERQQGRGHPSLGASGYRSDSRAGGALLCAGGSGNVYDTSPPPLCLDDTPADKEASDQIRLLKMIRLLRLLKILRMVKMSRLLTKFQESMQVKSGIMISVKFALLSGVTAHYLACGRIKIL
eukprot:SAG25_NODE_3075_length_1229_cov_1.099912_2_plen_181_part_00